MQWGNEQGVRVWKKGAEVTFDEVNLYQLLKMLYVPQEHYIHHGILVYIKVYDQPDRNYRVVSYKEGNQLAHDYFMSFSEDSKVTDEEREKMTEAYRNAISIEKLDTILEFKRLGWIELVDLPRENDLIDLN